MPALILFGSGSQGESGGKGSRSSEALKVSDDAEAVVRKLNQAKTGLVGFQAGKGNRTVWVNRDQVRMVRDVVTRGKT
jgi:hypothetical protein